MSVAKIDRDIQLLENKLEEIDTIIGDPIERNEQQKDLKKKIKKLQRTKKQIEQQEIERQELESLKSEFIFNKDKPVDLKEHKRNYGKQNRIKKETEATFTVSSQSISTDPTSEGQNRSKIPWIKILSLIILGLIITNTISIALIFSFNNARKLEVARLKELAEQETIKAQEQSERAKQERRKAIAAEEDAEQAKQLAIQAQKEAEQANKKAIQAQKKADDLIKNNLYTKTDSRISPIEFIKKYYSNINNNNYNLTWQQFTPQRRASSGSFQAYLSWWNTVQNTEIEQIEILEQDSDRAIVYTELNYFMKTGTIYRNRKSKIYLVWDRKSNNWLIENHQQL